MAITARVMVGRMRHRIVVTTIASTQETTLGSWSQAETTDSTRWASIDPITGMEKITAGQLVPEATHIIRTRFNTAIVPSVVLKKGSREFQVVSVVNVEEADIVLEMLCKELI